MTPDPTRDENRSGPVGTAHSPQPILQAGPDCSFQDIEEAIGGLASLKLTHPHFGVVVDRAWKLCDEAKQFRSRISQLEAENAELVKERDNASRSNIRAIKSVLEKDREISSLHTLLAEKKAKNAALQEECDRGDADIKEACDDLQKVIEEKEAEIARLKASLSERDEALREAHGLFADICHPACPSPINCKKGCDCQLCEVERVGWKIEKMLGIVPSG